MASKREICIRPMEKCEKKKVYSLMKRSFPLIQQLFFSFTSKVFVAEKDGALQGAIVLKTFYLSKKRKIGLLYWGFVHPEARGEGVGRLLYDAGIRILEEEKCTEILGCIEGHNTSSSNLLASRGFDILSPGAQLKRFGLHTFFLWLHIFHYLDIGHFLWARPTTGKKDSPVLQWWGTLLLSGTLITLSRLFLAKSSPAAVALFLALLSLFGFRYLAMKGTAFFMGLNVRFRAWESGFFLFFVLSLFVPGILYPVSGGLYPDKNKWHYTQELPCLGPIAFAGVLSPLFLIGSSAILCHLLSSWAPGTLMGQTFSSQWVNLLNDTLRYITSYGKTFLLFDALFIFFPFTCFNGRRIWDWNKPVWVGTALTTMLAIFS